MKDYDVELADPHGMDILWAHVKDLVGECAVQCPEMECGEDFYSSLVSGFTGMFVVLKAGTEEVLGIALFQRACYPHGSVCKIRAIAGENIPHWISGLNEAVYIWAFKNDCQHLHSDGSVGFKKHYTEQGWNVEKVVYSRPVSGVLH